MPSTIYTTNAKPFYQTFSFAEERKILHFRIFRRRRGVSESEKDLPFYPFSSHFLESFRGLKENFINKAFPFPSQVEDDLWLVFFVSEYLWALALIYTHAIENEGGFWNDVILIIIEIYFFIFLPHSTLHQLVSLLTLFLI